jgi:hypothetical protein
MKGIPISKKRTVFYLSCADTFLSICRLNDKGKKEISKFES